MLSGAELKDFRERCGLSLRDVEAYCDVTNQLIGQIENGMRNVTEYNHKEICNGINKAYFALVNGELITKNKQHKKQPITKQ